MYMSVTIPGLRDIITPRTSTADGERIASLRVLSAGNVIIAICLFGIVVLQAGQEFARRIEARELHQLATKERLPEAEKKTQ